MPSPLSFVPGVRRVAAGWKRRLLGGPETRRAAYKAVWNAQSKSEDAAKLAVAGYTSEDKLARAAGCTVQFLRETVRIRPEDAVLEIGVGRVGRALAPLCRQWTGADVSEAMLTHLRRRLADLPNVRGVVLSGYDLSPFPAGELDVVYSTVVFMHLDEWERYRYVREAYRVLRPGGRVYVDNFNLLSDEGWTLFEAILALDPLARPPHASRASTPQELVAYLQRAGFVDVRHWEVGMWTIAHGVKPGGS
jgi:SAM-dependent methyltransferase